MIIRFILPSILFQGEGGLPREVGPTRSEGPKRSWKAIAEITASMVILGMPIYRHEPVFTIGREPLVAGTIVVRNETRARRRQEKQLRWRALAYRLRMSRPPVLTK
jgi:hypothetical protein